MKPTDTWWEENEEGDVICVFHGDQHRRTIAVRKEDFPLPAWKVADLMNEAFRSGVTAKAQQIRRELGL
jgi:cytolysin (calcineurin-like family phosphatase)